LPALAAGAVERRAAALPRLPDRAAADATTVSLAAVDEVFELEIAGCAVGADVVAQRAAALRDRRREHVAHRVDEPREPRPRQSIGPRAGMNGRAEQRFVRVDVPDAGDDAVVHQRGLDRRTARARRAPEVL